jgi:hypothetical protein
MAADVLDNLSHPCHAALGVAHLEVGFVQAPPLAIGLLDVAFGVNGSIVHEAEVQCAHAKSRMTAIRLVREKKKSILGSRGNRLVSIQPQPLIRH